MYLTNIHIIQINIFALNHIFFLHIYNLKKSSVIHSLNSLLELNNLSLTGVLKNTLSTAQIIIINKKYLYEYPPKLLLSNPISQNKDQ